MEHLINSVKQSLKNKNWYGALIVVLTLPDIAGKIEHPNLNSGKRYANWYDKYILDKYKGNIGPDRVEHIFLSGNDCYALRCAYLHEGKSNIVEQRARDILCDFEFLQPPNDWKVHKNQVNDKLQLQVDIFCYDIINGIEEWLKDIVSDDEKQNKLTDFLKVYDLK